MTRSKTVKLAESAVLVAAGFGLSYVRIKFLPYGGAVTLLSMLPILMVGYRNGIGWGLGAGLVYSLLQCMQDGALLPPAAGLGTYLCMMLLDYILAFTALGASALFRKKKHGLALAAVACLSFRFVCHVASGILLWGSYAWDGWPVVPYSIVYNASYMVPEILLTTLGAYLLGRYLPEKFWKGL